MLAYKRFNCFSKALLVLFLITLVVPISIYALPAPGNDNCSASSPLLTSSTSCTNTTGDLQDATNSAPIGACGGATATTTYDVWYRYQAKSTPPTITVNTTGSQLNNATTYIEVLSGSCGSFTSIACGSASSPLTVTGLANGTTYYIRVYVTTNPNVNGSNRYGFTICIQDPPANDNCSGAITLTSSTTCNNTAGTLNLSTASTGLPAGCEPVGTHYDVWYSYVATNTTERFSLSSLVNISNPAIQLYSGTCGSLTSIACGTTSITATSLTVGTTYYIRVSNIGSQPSGSSFNICIQDPPSNDKCATPVNLTSGTSCSNTAGTIDMATVSTSGLPVGCEPVGTHYDVWYTFTAVTTQHTVTLSSINASFTNPAIQLYSGTCGAFTSLQCGTTSLTATGLTVGTVYYVRVSNVGSAISNTAATFNICVTNPTPPPANDDCSGAVSLTANTSCSNTASTLVGATATTGLPAGCESPGTLYDVWFRFNAGATYEIITISSLAGNFTNPQIQLYSGACGSLTSLQCGTTSMTATGLTVGTTYYVRVSNIGTAITSSGSFNICIYHPAPATVDIGKSYINISKGTGGGTINPGDTLEIRATLVIRSGALDSLSYVDTIKTTSGFSYIPGSLALRTNEGKVYKSYTDAFDSDEGYIYTSGSDNVIRINFGNNSSNVARGRLRNTSRPRVSSSCLVMATYRVAVTAAYGSTINVGGGYFTSRDSITTISNTLSFNPRSAVVYNSPGLCPNSVAATNALGGDFNGTFGTPSTGAPLARNRGTSTNVLSYIYRPFATGQGPNDYYYGIANNTSATYTTSNTFAKPDSRRVFNLWDITGDHTGATDPTKGNRPCDTTQPVSPTNPCGYMLIINSAYKTDTAFQYDVSNLCPNTYYEISAWYKNVCSKCSSDSNGVQAGSAGYIPFAPGDSSGVQPNIAFDIDGVDYYTTGNIAHNGVATTQQGSDSTNTWVKRGFVFQTGPSQTSLRITMRNNAPGGGGNDWAMDDISFATCNPVQVLDPATSYIGCSGAAATTFTDSVRAYYTNYRYVRWEKSCDNGTTWSTLQSNTLSYTSRLGNDSLAQTTYTFLPVYADSGCLVRVKTATTLSNLSNVNCSVVSSASVRLNISNCVTLNVPVIDFNATLVNQQAHLKWSINASPEVDYFIVERSSNGSGFSEAGQVQAYYSSSGELQHYQFNDPVEVIGEVFYRIKIIAKGDKKFNYSRIVYLSNKPKAFVVTSVINPFKEEIKADVVVNKNGMMQVELVNIFGQRLIASKVYVTKGLNKILLQQLSGIGSGNYYVRFQFDDTIINKPLLKTAH